MGFLAIWTIRLWRIAISGAEVPTWAIGIIKPVVKYLRTVCDPT